MSPTAPVTGAGLVGYGVRGRLATAVKRMAFPERVEALVLSGGGMKGVAALGAVSSLQKAGVLKDVRTVVGTSAGALIAAAVATRRATPQLLDELSSNRYKPDIDLSNLMASFGLDSGRHLEAWIKAVLGGRQYTFRDIREVYGTRLVVCATNVTDRRPEYFCPDFSPDMDVALALRMSCTVPLYFSAVRHGGKVYVDGAVADNFPLSWASRNCEHGDRVLGIAFAPRASAPDTMDAYLGALLECVTIRHDHDAAPGGRADLRVLQLDLGRHSAFDFNMSRKDMKKLCALGSRQCRAWMKKHQ